jgi:hypothetical protein
VRSRCVFDAPWSPWSERALAAGFFDHPQMARDFRRPLGRAPSKRAKRPGGDRDESRRRGRLTRS